MTAAYLSREVLVRLELVPSITTLASAKRPIVRQHATKRTHTWRMAHPLSLRAYRYCERPASPQQGDIFSPLGLLALETAITTLIC